MNAGSAAPGRSLSGRVWQYRAADERAVEAVVRAAGVSDGLARLLVGRGIGPDQAGAWLRAGTGRDLPDGSSILDLDRAAALLADAVVGKRRIGILGDYDVDGAASTAQLVRYLRAAAAEPVVHIPDRVTEGYGPSTSAIDRLRAAGASLVVTVDCGVTAFTPLRHAAGLGLPVIVVDHHVAEAALPPAAAVVNPNRTDDRSGLGALTSSALVWLLIRALHGELGRRGHRSEAPDPESLLDLAALGTVCDVAPLNGANRVLVRRGLRVLARGGNPGLRAIAAAAGLDEAPEAWHMGFVYGPRINAAGRVGDARLGLHVLETDDAAAAGRAAGELELLNRQRQSLEAQVYADAVAQAEAGGGERQAVVMVVGGDWHVGVIGIVASRLVDRFRRPAVVCAREGGGIRGSARSVDGIDIGGPVIRARQAGLLEAGGGHPMAAGFSGRADRWEALAAFLNAEVRAARPAGSAPSALMLDGVLAVSGVSVALGTELAQAGPFGVGNPSPCYAFRRVFPVHARVVGTGHVSCLLADDTRGRVRAIAFRSADTPVGAALLRGRPVDIAGQIQVSTWRGKPRAEVHIRDVAACRS